MEGESEVGLMEQLLLKSVDGAAMNVVRLFLTGAHEEAMCCRGNNLAFDL